MTKEEINKLITDNLLLVYSFCSRYRESTRFYFDFDELISIAQLGLVKAANTFDKDKNITFSTYSFKVMRNDLFRALEKVKKFTNNNTNISIQAPVSADCENVNLEDILSSDFDIVELADTNILIQELYNTIQELPENMQQVINYKLQGKTQVEIGKILGITHQRVQQIQNKAVYKIRVNFRLRGLI